MNGTQAPVVIDVIVPKHCILNANKRPPHWAVAAKAVKQLRAMAASAWLMQRLPPMRRAHCVAEYTFRDNTVRDVANWYPTTKALIDGAVGGPFKGMRFVGILPDDSNKYLTGPDPRVTEPDRTLFKGTIRVRLIFTEAP